MVIIACIAIVPVVRRFVAQVNTPEYFEVMYGIDRKEFEDFARLYGVQSDKVNGFGGQTFPVNYIRWKVDWEANRDNGVSVARVVAETKGALALCKDSANTWWYYFYTLNRDDGRDPLVMGLSITGQTVTNIYALSLYDSGQEGGIALHCLSDSRKLIRFAQ
jgi:hypothetical protein